MSLILLGFSQEAEIRHFAFERVAADGTRTGCIVHADLPMARRFNVKIQDLPLICRRVLAAHTEDQRESVVVTADEMRSHAEGVAASTALGRAGKRPRSANTLSSIGKS